MDASPRLPWELMLLVLYNLRPPQLQHFAKVCKATRKLVEKEKHRTFDVTSILRPFFRQPGEFRLLQARTGMLVSGSQVLQLLDRVSYGVRDLDLYIWTATAHIVIDWLIYHGYTLKSRAACPPDTAVLLRADVINARFGTMLDDNSGNAYFLRPGQMLFKFEKGELRIDLVVTRDTPFACILDFHGTAVMNFFSSDVLVSLFPHANFVERLNLVVRFDGGRRMRTVLSKYERRGFTPTFVTESSESFALGERWVRGHLSTNPSVRRSSPWVQDLPPVAYTDTTGFWTSREYNLNELDINVLRTGRTQLYRCGFTLSMQGDDPEIKYAHVQGSRRSYCVSPAFARWRHDRMNIILDDDLVTHTGIAL